MTEIPDGILLTPFDDSFYTDPYAVYKKLRELAPVHKNASGFWENTWTISDYSHVRQLLTDERLSVDPRTIGLRRDPRADNPVTLREPDMMNLDGADHHRLRALVRKAFTPSSIESFRPTIERIIDSCLTEITHSPFDAVAAIAKPVPTIVIAEYIGVDSADHKKFKAWTDSLLKQGFPMPTEEQWQEIIDADQSLRDYMTAVIEHRKQNLQDDLISRLIVAKEEEQKLSDDEIVDMVCLLIGAGNFTTTDLISNSLYQMLAGDSDVNAGKIVEETLRFDPPAMSVRRFVTKDIEIGNQEIKAGSVVNLLTGAANHDPGMFSQADDFVVDRQGNDHLAFGRGIHHCLGASLARLEATVTLEKIREKFPNLSLESSERSRRMDFRGFRNLVVSF